LKSTETLRKRACSLNATLNFSNFGSLKSTETGSGLRRIVSLLYFSNFGSLKSTETRF